MKAGIAQALCGKLLHVWRRDTASEDTKLPKAYVIKQDQQNVGRTFWGAKHLRKCRRIGVLIRPPYLSLEAEVRPRKRLSWLWRWNRGRCRCTGLGCLRRGYPGSCQ